ncbi:hypothetical protein AB4851_24790 [Burkholderia sp. 22PA0099]|uniref:hypothetical protein n=1 Tax=Burkholderia sp. 22PA0099 TaxID=3237372 RepID=UPI0039C37BA1
MIKEIGQIINTPTTLLGASITSIIVSAAFGYFFKRKENCHKAELDYEYEQKKASRELIARYKGRLLREAVQLTNRQWNLYSNWDKGWMKINYQSGTDGYYFTSTIYRFLSLYTLTLAADSEAILLDTTISSQSDYDFIKYLAIIRWVITDVSLFSNLNYDPSIAHDHFFSDNLKIYTNPCWVDGKMVSYDIFRTQQFTSAEMQPVLNFFDDLKKNETRYRWDRLVALHLILATYANKFGYDLQRTSKTKLRTIAQEAQNPEILKNLIDWLKRHHLTRDRETKKLIRALKAELKK